MQITISFNPEVDHFDTVLKRLSGVYGEQVSKSTPTFNVTELVESQVLTDEPAIIVDAEQVAEQLPPAMKATLEIDVDGVPWDARIHSDAAEPKTQSGRWKKKRGVDTEEYDRITRELQLLASGKVGTDELPIPTLPIKTEETPLVEVAPDQFEVAAVKHELAQLVSTPHASDQFEVATLITPPAPIPTTHVDLMKWVATQLATRKLTSIDITEVIKAGNLNNLGELEHMGEEWIKWAFESLQVRLK